MNKLILFGLLIFSAFSAQLDAQSYMGIEFNYMQGLDQYGENLNSSPKGIGLSYMFKPWKNKKLYLGGQIGVSMYATDTYEQSIKIDEDLSREIEIEEEDCFFSYGLIGRYFLVENKRVNPYIEGRVGGLSFFSTKMTEEENDEYFENSTTFHGTSFQLGIGGGLNIHIVDNLWIDINVIYNQGSRADYRNIGTADVAYRLSPELSQFESYTDNLNYSFGVQFGF